ncbi:MAG: trigger factor [Desulfobacteraceae bacterium 4484_190.3]|nr:MAG: trigger factor [Desulfobacteraceae bacterium 4484_190.3]
MGQIEAEVSIEDISSVKRKMLFEIPWADVKKELDKAYHVIGKKAKVKGFRPGKTPRKVLEMYYKNQAEEEAVSILVGESYADAVKENRISVVDNPVIDQKGIELNKNFKYTATVEIEPVFEPKDYIGLEVEKEEYEVKDEDVEARLEQLRQMYSTLESIEDNRGIIEGDFVNIDFEGKVDGKTSKKLTSKNYMLEIGSKIFVPGFEDQLIGVNKGESKEIKVRFPDDYPSKNVAGKDGIFSVSVNDIKEKRLPDLDENFIKNFDAYDKLEDLKKDIRESLVKENETRINADLKNMIIDRLLENNEFEIPSVFVNRQIDYMALGARQRMINDGMNPEKAAEISSNLHDRFKSEAEKIVKTSLLIHKIAEKESITVDEKDIEVKLRELARKLAQDYESLKASYETNNLKEHLKNEILEQKTLDFLKEKSDIRNVKKSNNKKYISWHSYR